LFQTYWGTTICVGIWCTYTTNIKCYFWIGVNMTRKTYSMSKKYVTGDDQLLDETIDLYDDSFDVEEFENDPQFDPNDHEYLQEINNDEAEGQPLPLDRYFSRFGKGSKRNR